MRQVVLDTETTGLEVSQGHRIIEIGCVEIVDGSLPVVITTSTSSRSAPLIKAHWKYTALPKNSWPISPSSRALRTNLWTSFEAPS